MFESLVTAALRRTNKKMSCLLVESEISRVSRWSKVKTRFLQAHLPDWLQKYRILNELDNRERGEARTEPRKYK